MSPHIEHAHVLPSGSSSSSSTCTCNSQQKVNARNLVVCIDGTSNRFGQNNTNVVKLLAKINLKTTHPEQYAYYSSGIGMRPKSINIFSRMERAVTDNFDMAAAWNIDEIVKDAYAWLARMYQEGDQIYLFGFSRGAYQVRVLAGMIHEVRPELIIDHGPDEPLGRAYEYYETIRSRKSKIGQIAKEFKSTFCWTGMRVHFIGVWDTVSSVWLRRGEKFLSKSSSAAHACHFRHALALDERRVKFIPEYFHEMNSQTHDGKSKYITPDLKEVWFAGSHSDVWAGNVSLLWMRQEAAANGLVLEPTDIVWVPDDLDFGTSNSMSPIWRVIEYMPIKQQVSFSGAGENDRRCVLCVLLVRNTDLALGSLHRLLPRRIIPGQKVHASVLYANMYKPQATLGEGFDIPIIHSGLEYTELDNRIWEMGLPFEDNVTTAQELVTHLGSQQGVAPIYLDRLLFMLQFSQFL
ncbi:hypothetical protein OG21DRAFT_1412956 [Imleria badia]|nr:hypothetical protein OG21DRAFT_1412956 [Imleria badia]